METASYVNKKKERKKKRLTQTLRGGALEQIIDSRADDNPLPGAVHPKRADLDAVLAADGLDEGRLPDHLD